MAINHRFIGSVALSLVDLAATTGTFSGAITADSAAITNAITGASLTTTGDVGCATVTATSTITATTSVSVGSGAASLVSSGVQSASSASRCYSTHASAGWTLLSNVTSAADVCATYAAAINNLTHDGASLVTGTHNNGAARSFRISARGGYAIYLTNKSGGAVATGDVVVIDTTTASSFTTTTTADDPKVIGVVLSSSIANDASGWVTISGVAKVSVTGTVAIGDILATDTNAKKAITNATPTAGAILGKALTADAAGYCTALIQTR